MNNLTQGAARHLKVVAPGDQNEVACQTRHSENRLLDTLYFGILNKRIPGILLIQHPSIEHADVLRVRFFRKASELLTILGDDIGVEI